MISTEHRARIAESVRAWHAANPMTEETRARIAQANRGRRHSDVTREKQRAAALARCAHPEERERLRVMALEREAIKRAARVDGAAAYDRVHVRLRCPRSIDDLWDVPDAREPPHLILPPSAPHLRRHAYEERDE